MSKVIGQGWKFPWPWTSFFCDPRCPPAGLLNIANHVFLQRARGFGPAIYHCKYLPVQHFHGAVAESSAAHALAVKTYRLFQSQCACAHCCKRRSATKEK